MLSFVTGVRVGVRIKCCEVVRVGLHIECCESGTR